MRRKEQKIVALILAAGFSSRMDHEAKALKKLAGKSFLQRVSHSFAVAGLDKILVISGHESDSVSKEAEKLGLNIIYNEDFAQGMFSSIKKGVRACVGKADAILFTPVDAALFLPKTVEEIIKRHSHDPDKIIIPRLLEESGHPALIPAKYWQDILKWEKDENLRTYYAHLAGTKEFFSEGHEKHFIFLDLPDEGILSDIDSPEDLLKAENFLNITSGRTNPSIKEAWSILVKSEISYLKKVHSLLVAQLSLRFAEELKIQGHIASPHLAVTAGILHDTFRNENEHAQRACQYFTKLGWLETAYIAGCHTSLPPFILEHAGTENRDFYFFSPPWPPPFDTDEEMIINTALCVFMADKFVKNDRLVTVEERFSAIKKYYCNNEKALKGISNRQRISEQVGSFLSKKLGTDLLTLVRIIEKSQSAKAEMVSEFRNIARNKGSLEAGNKQSAKECELLSICLLADLKKEADMACPCENWEDLF